MLTHIGAAYATGPFLDACLRTPVKQVEQLLGNIYTEYNIGLDRVNTSRERFERKLQVTNERLLQLAASSLSSRVIQKRRVIDASDDERYALSLLFDGAPTNFYCLSRPF